MRVLLVDDSAGFRRFCSTVCQSIGLDVVEAEDGAVALQRLREQDFDLMLLDLVMPVLSGVGLLRVLAANPDIAPARTIVCSATPECLEREYPEGLGMVEQVLQKPQHAADLVAALLPGARLKSTG